MSITVDFYISLYKKDVYSAVIGMPSGKRNSPLDRHALDEIKWVAFLSLITDNGRRGPESNFNGT